MSIFSSLYTGVSGLNAAEIQIATTGNNISNANSTFYTRQRVVQTTGGYITAPGGAQVGTGTSIETIVRLHDEHAYWKLKNATTQLEYTQYMGNILTEISQRFPDIQSTGILKDLESYNKAWNDFASNPNESATKIALIEATKTLTQNINNTFSNLDRIQKTINDDIKLTVDEINKIGSEIANINKQLSGEEILDSERANELRDRRDELELQLSKLVDGVASKNKITQDSSLDSTITDGGKYYNLSIEGMTLVDGDSFHPLELEFDNQQESYSILYKMSDEKVIDLTGKLKGGKLGAQLDLRGRYYDQTENKYTDGMIQEYKDMLDTFAKTLITQTNNIYASSATEGKVSDPLKGLSRDFPLMSYDKNLQAGTFDIVVYDASGKEVGTKSITINENTTMESLLAQINADTDDNGDNNNTNDVDDFLSASYNYDAKTGSGTFQLSPKNGHRIAIKSNDTNFAGALNIGGFFSGNDASSIKVNSNIENNPDSLKASSNGVDGNNDVANAIVQLQYEKVNFYNEDGTVSNLTMEEYYRKFTGQIASDGENNNIVHSSNATLYNSVYGEYQSKTGVNTNEELAALIQYQSSYGAAAKIVSTVDQMLETLLGIKS
ncbi:flagellar hook-associated protein FlgK [Campylobacter sp. US33a]|uniref:flagellar hook-associated protein FlgK n=1 Tax=Campylobacter sp. US33a TaxID=2498120 RepID=UPI0010674B0F|nr:flagellar hook-associated protein FlgK [Campylobacter sp. US33a]TEY03957.1 flagellar hook-associated protein FlgK [Campylobacter sp. US33a]